MFLGIDLGTSAIKLLVINESNSVLAKLIKKLKKVVGLKFVRHGGRHDIWVTKDGREIPIPRHPGDLGRGLVRDIISQAGMSVGLREFLNI